MLEGRSTDDLCVVLWFSGVRQQRISSTSSFLLVLRYGCLVGSQWVFIVRHGGWFIYFFHLNVYFFVLLLFVIFPRDATPFVLLILFWERQKWMWIVLQQGWVICDDLTSLLLFLFLCLLHWMSGLLIVVDLRTHLLQCTYRANWTPPHHAHHKIWRACRRAVSPTMAAPPIWSFQLQQQADLLLLLRFDSD